MPRAANKKPKDKRIAPKKLQTAIVVDTNHVTSMQAAKILREFGCETIIELTSAYEAIQLAKQRNIDLTLCAEKLSDMTAFELLEEMQYEVDILRGTFVLALDRPSREQMIEAINWGVDAVVARPYDINQTKDLLSQAVSSFSEQTNPEKIYEIAKQHLKNERFREAEKLFNLLAQSTSAERSLFGLAACARMKKDYDRALVALDKAQESDEMPVAVYELRAKVHRDAGQIEEAIKSLITSVETFCKNPIRYLNAAAFLASEKCYQDLTKVLDLAEKENVAFPESHMYRAQAYLGLEDYRKACKYLRELVLKFPESVEYLTQLAGALRYSGELEEALKIYNKILLIQPDSMIPMFNKAILLDLMSRKEEAEKFLIKLLEKFPQFEAARDKLAQIQQKASIPMAS